VFRYGTLFEDVFIQEVCRTTVGGSAEKEDGLTKVSLGLCKVMLGSLKASLALTIYRECVGKLDEYVSVGGS
jgi:hypothetical protein